ncbi:xanthine dehydrogenase subunit D [Ureibacillus chungkukjangi]|uniref:Xanthine dehydrogenase molybdenum binding subunit apoprotein n=1 Tax=Ureibacillus chungkukjangi TaxID=1202712 RepID=A0A318TMV8_9BACL|nr:xanthine dehydrogenase subunit D [Ureibacillus chungkukjangi]PYF05217.1 xanthine dehydrogenase molybdenum binding subunit apoprotein [Ureibacillus chungkukjangi]
MKSNIQEKEDRVRPDGLSKVTGALKYLTDLTFPNMLYAKILRSAYPHAKILSINTAEAEKLPGVASVITYKDVPGMNRFGIIIPDQPVLCEERVRTVGDAVAAVAATSYEIAEMALKLIQVEYEELPIIDTPEKGLEPNAIKLHPAGNICHRSSYINGDIEEAFKACEVIVEETYELPRQLHGYMETEGGVVVPQEDGGITVYAATQHGFKDRFQLSRILGIPEGMIRIFSSPMGGSFGGKDELNIQPYAALLALKTNCPVKIHNTRAESLRASLKRHPMKITAKTGTDRLGKILAHQVKIIADKGAYATLGPAVLDFAVEHAAGPYIIPNIETGGVSVFTNNGVTGEFRGFGGNQITFALEGQLDRLAAVLNMDPIELRQINLRNATDLGPLGHRIAPTDSAALVLKEIQRLYQKSNTPSKDSNWKRYGSGIAIAMHGGGLGFGRLDSAGGRIFLNKEGKIEISFGFEECGQGLLSVIENIAIEEIGCSAEDIQIVIGDTSVVPVSGSSTASRGTSIVWQSMQKMKEPFKNKLIQHASISLSIPAENLYLGPTGIWELGKEEGPCMTYKTCAEGLLDSTVLTSFHFPVTPDAVNGGHFLYSFGGVKVDVEVDILSGMVKVMSIDHVISAGPVVSPKGFRGQIEGGGVMSLGYTLMEEVKMMNSQYATQNFDTYLMPNIVDIPFDTNVYAIEELYEGDIYGPRGVGEIGTIAITPAIIKAIHDAIGCWVTKLPISSEDILEKAEARGMLSWI